MRGNRGRGEGCAGDHAGPGGNVALWWDREERWERQGEIWCAACDSARNERIGQQHTVKTAPQKLCCIRDTHVQSDPEEMVP